MHGGGTSRAIKNNGVQIVATSSTYYKANAIFIIIASVLRMARRRTPDDGWMLLSPSDVAKK